MLEAPPPGGKQTSPTKRYLESLPEDQQNAILGPMCIGGISPADCCGCEICNPDEDEINIRAFVGGNMDEDGLTRRLVEGGILEL